MSLLFLKKIFLKRASVVVLQSHKLLTKLRKFQAKSKPWRFVSFLSRDMSLERDD